MSLWNDTPTKRTLMPHVYQMLLLLSDAKENVASTGQGSGKSTFAPFLIANLMFKFGTGYEYIFSEPTYDMVARTAIPDTMELFDGTDFQGWWADKKHNIYENKFGKIHFVSTEKPEHIQGIHAKGVVMDEAGQSSRLAYMILRSRTNLMDGQIFLLTNPYRNKDPYIYTYIKKRWEEGDPDVLYLEYDSIINPAFNKKRYEADRKILKPEEFEFQYGGKFSKPVGLVFIYDDLEVIKEKKYNKERCVAGLDLGVGDPTVLEVGMPVEKGLHFIDEYYKASLSGSAHVEAISMFVKKYNIRTIFYDPRGLAMKLEIEKGLKEKQISVEFRPVNTEVASSIKLVDDYIRSGRLTMSAKCRELLNEDAGYLYGSNGLPEKGNDHAEDARRYCVVGYNTFIKKREKFSMQNILEQKPMNILERKMRELKEMIEHPKPKKAKWMEEI